jgi:dUTP pyrophosphatase
MSSASSSPILKVVKHYPDSVLSSKKHPSDSGFDLRIHHFQKIFTQEEEREIQPDLEKIWLPPFGRILVHTGISATIEDGYELQVRPRSGLAIKKGLTVLNTPGTIDASYRGAICVIVINMSQLSSQELIKGMKIAQLVPCPVLLPQLKEIESLDETERGSGGFGSTGE